jgi:hypothetical protein
VAAEHRDRPHVGGAVAEVEGKLEALEQTFADADAGGGELLRRTREVGSAVDWAEGLWRSEMETVARVETELAAADQRYRRALGTYYGSGVSGDWQGAYDALVQARQAVANGELEEALTLARRCVERIEAEDSRARREAAEIEAARLRRLRDAERAARLAAERAARRAAAEAAAAAAAAAAERAARRASSSSGPSFTSSRSSYGSINRPPGLGGGGGSRRSSPPRGGPSSGGSRSGGSRLRSSSRSGGSRW